MQTIIGRAGWLTTAVATLWLILAAPAYVIAGRGGLEGMSLAALLCLVPGWLVFYLGSRYRVAKMQVLIVLFGSTVRLLFVLAGVLIVRSVRPQLGVREFLIWIIVFYLATLLIETLHVVRQSSPQHGAKK